MSEKTDAIVKLQDENMGMLKKLEEDNARLLDQLKTAREALKFAESRYCPCGEPWLEAKDHDEDCPRRVAYEALSKLGGEVG